MWRIWLRGLPMTLVSLFAGVAWYFGASRLAARLGPPDIAPVVGAIVALGVALTVWRRGAADLERASIERLICPSCGGALATEHEHRSVTQPGGLQVWSCADCGYHRAQALTCEGCAT